MKKSSRYIFSLGLAMVLASCTSNFDEINTDPTQSTPKTFDANYFLSSAEWNYLDGITGYNGPILFQSGWMQIFASTSTLDASYYSNADKYLQSNNTNSYLASTWNREYRSASLANEGIKTSSQNPDMVNVTAAATIMKILAVQAVSDTYGDVPYTTALQALDFVTQPTYDKQEDLYPMLLSQLDAAVKSFDEAKAKPTADLSPYNGDIKKWRKFGYSVMLRMAMRLVKANAALAKTYAEKAAAGGTFESSADDMYIKPDGSAYAGNNANALLTAGDFYEARWSKTFIDYLKDAGDPRLGVIAEVPQNGLKANKDTNLPGDSDPAKQIGLPNGYDLAGGATDITHEPNYPGSTNAPLVDDDGKPVDNVAIIGKYSRPKAALYARKNAPIVIMTYAQTELLLADALKRNFNVGGTAAGHYHNGVVGAMLALTPFGGTIDAVAAETFATANPLDESSTEASLEQINTQYWATTGSLLDFSEAWSNWRRSGFPVLTPVVYAGNFSGGTIPRRQKYPTTEPTLNPTSYQAAAGRIQGGDNWTSRVWWDQ